MNTTQEVQREQQLRDADAALNKAADLHICFKPGTSTNVMIDIIEQMLAGKTWGDELTLTADSDSRNCIGTSFRRLKNVGLVAETGAHRRSSLKSHKGRRILQYTLPNPELARTFLRRNGRAPKTGQMEFPQ